MLLGGQLTRGPIRKLGDSVGTCLVMPPRYNEGHIGPGWIRSYWDEGELTVVGEVGDDG